VPATRAEPVVTRAERVPVPAPRAEAAPDLPRPRPPDANESLLGDTSGLRARWMRAQASFVDNPRDAVSAASDLVDQTAQAFAAALQQRQQRLLAMWERDPAAANGSAASDTEELRLVMQRYRALFNQLCRP
jgi:hypothetical protein